MILIVIGLCNLAIGAAYAGLGLLSAWETISLHRSRGWSPFGIGFALMAASCGPHHLTHGWYILQGGPVSWPMLIVTLIGLPSGLTFCLLRFEASRGGPGERWLSLSTPRMVLLAGGYALVAGGLAAASFLQPEASTLFQAICTSGTAERAAVPGLDIASVTFVANLFVAVTYSMVGWYLADTQVRRRFAGDAWSLSGVALAGVFFTCALMHVIEATSGGGIVMLIFDLIGIPASVYFLWVIRQLHNDSMSDWNRRPIIGTAEAPARPSPWSGSVAR